MSYPTNHSSYSKTMNTNMTSSNNPTNVVTNCDNNTSCSNNNNKIYKGVRKRKWGKWVSEIRLPNSRERIWLGSYDSQEKAARAFDAALYCLRGPNATFNFSNTPLTINLNLPFQSLSSHEIQQIASNFANEIEISSTQEEEVVPIIESQNDDDSLCHVYDNNNDDDDLRRMDWKFEDMFDDLNGVTNCYDFGLNYGIDKMQYSYQLFEDHIECEDSFSNHSFLWSWNF